MRAMPYRTPVFAVAACAAALAASAPASAKIIEVGRTDVAPACPATPCVAISRTTGYQIKIADERGSFVVPEDGKIVAWTVVLGKPTKEQISFFNKGLGGPPTARLTVLRTGKKLFSRVVTQSPIQQLTPFLGQTVQFPLGRALNVKKGYVIALTVPTWAPVLTPLLADHSAWRASRPGGKCLDTGTQTAQMTLRKVAQYRCLYKARLVYSATLITHPVPNADAGRVN
jgi:hypothetical protein